MIPMDEENGSALAGHPLGEDERIIGQILVTFTGSPKHGTDEDVMEDTIRLVRQSVIDNRSYYGEMVHNLHVVIEHFDPEVFFG